MNYLTDGVPGPESALIFLRPLMPFRRDQEISLNYPLKKRLMQPLEKFGFPTHYNLMYP